MDKKQVLTNKEIENDIATALKNPPQMQKKEYKSSKLPGFIIALIVIILTYIYPKQLFCGLLIFMLGILCYGILIRLQHKYEIKHISIRNYYIIHRVVHSIDEEHYYIKGSKFDNGEYVNNYFIRFENKKTWHIPKDNYLWTVERPMSDRVVYEYTHRGDEFIVVTKKRTGKIVVAYNTNFFEYREN